MDNATPMIVMENVDKWYGHVQGAHQHQDLTVGRGEKIVLCGPSGSGEVDVDSMHQPPRGLPSKGGILVDGIEA